MHQRIKEIEGRKVFSAIGEVPEEIDTVTLYVAANISDKLSEEIIARKPRRVIFNPGAENPVLAQKLRTENIEPVEACTLVMLRTGRF